MKKKRFIFPAVLVSTLLLILITICVEYKIEENRLKDNLDSGIVYINNKKIKLPISINNFEKKFGKVDFKSELYDEDNYFYYNGNKNKSNSIKPNIKIEGLLKTDNEKVGVFLLNPTKKKQKIKDCYIIGVRLNNRTELFDNISLSTSKKELIKKLHTGKLNPFYKSYPGLITYTNKYMLEAMYHDDEMDDIIYYFNYDRCKDNNCSKYMK